MKKKTSKKAKDVSSEQIIEKNMSQAIYTNDMMRPPFDPQKQNRRGLQVYHMAQLIGMTGRDEHGRLQTHTGENPVFYLTLWQRIQISRLSSPVFGVVTSRMNRVSAIDFNITPTKMIQDRIAEELKEMYQIYNEYKNSIEMEHLYLKAKIIKSIQETLPEMLPDMSNFQSSLLRWKRRIERADTQQGEEIKEWLMEPNQGVSWSTFIKKYVYDLLIHGCAAIYKQRINKVLDNFDTLPGGTVYKLKDPHFSTIEMYIQVAPGFEPQMMFSDEVMYDMYMPVSSHSYSFIPLECLINKVSESLLFDELMAKQADGTAPPEKMVVLATGNPFADLDKDYETAMPMDVTEQTRIEQKMNEPKKHKVITFTGNKAEILDLSREGTMEFQNNRQKDIRQDVAMVFNMSNMEINLTGSTDTSGRSTSEAQAEIEQGKGIGPILKSIEAKITKEIIPYKFGFGWQLEFIKSKNEREEKELDRIMLETGEMTENEVREKYNKSQFEGEQYDKPRGAQAPIPGQDEMNPMFTKGSQ